MASARPWRAWTRLAVVYAVPPIMNDPFGKCFCVPAMRACTPAKAAVWFCLDATVDMTDFLLSVRAHYAVMATARDRMSGAARAFVASPSRETL